MAILQDLIAQVKDVALRERLQDETDRLLHQKKFGLVFEEHLPEVTPLYDVPVRVGASVAPKIGYMKEVYRVLSRDGENVVCVLEDSRNDTKKTFSVGELVTVAKFGEAIYPCLKKMDTVENAPDSDLWHALIEADNYHALQLLAYLYAGKVDCIYIDPPYNSGAKDWKYNNNYVDANDAYRHSKWLSMMEKRLKLAKKLLNPDDSVMIVTIDEKEYLHLGCLLEEIFPEASMQMISSVINPSGVSRGNEFYRTDEYIFVLKIGVCTPYKVKLSDDWLTAKTTGKDKIRWRPIRRQGADDMRIDAPNQFYPIYISADGTHYVGYGESLPIDVQIKEAIRPKNISSDAIEVWPIKPDGTEGRWQIGQDTLKTLHEQGYIKITYTKKWGYTPQYLAQGERYKIDSGQFPVLGKDEYGTVITADAIDTAAFVPGTQWRITSHSAREYGTKMLRKIFLGKVFDFPKSLYAVMDVIRFFVAEKRDSLILDFFAGSGTTLHAVNLINLIDNGNRRCICVTNNEVSNKKGTLLDRKGIHIGDSEWERHGVARAITWPRIKGAILGKDINGNPLSGEYGVQTDKFVRCDDDDFEDEDEKSNRNVAYKKVKEDIYPELAGRKMSDGFRANVVYFKLGFLDKTDVSLGTQFKALLSTLWMKAGAIGRCPALTVGELPDMLLFPENRFAVLLDEMLFSLFTKQMEGDQGIRTIFFVTDSDINFCKMSTEFPEAETYQLYHDYLTNFHINTGGR